MIRLVLRQDDACMAANVGGPVQTSLKTFDVELPEVEAWLREQPSSYVERSFVGLELLPSADTGANDNG